MTRPSLATLLTLATLIPFACADDPSIELRRVGSVRAELQLDPDVAAILIEVFDAEGLVEQERVEAAPLDRPPEAIRSAWRLFTLPPGPHRLVATALGADDGPATHCRPVEETVQVVPIEVAAITLHPLCEVIARL